MLYVRATLEDCPSVGQDPEFLAQIVPEEVFWRINSLHRVPDVHLKGQH